ncbi:MAG: hypothetical protein KDJ16_15645 [Hyphomicrobiales bacterium]|nr:hypothetical protein [Rhodoblastus sp.]MCC2113467.1 hypothetical protein [Hyphomicrobiales bacterium]
MSTRFGAVFGSTLAFSLLALYSLSTFWLILKIVEAQGGAVAVSAGYTYVLTTVGGLVSALVIAQLSVTRPGEAPAIGGFEPATTVGVYATNTVVAIYLFVWIGTGLAALITGVMLYPDASKTISDLGTTWLGLAVSAAYAYFGIKPGGGNFARENAAKELSATVASIGDQLQQQITQGKILFDAGKPNLKDEILGKNAGAKVTVKLQSLVLELSKLSSQPIRISELLRTTGDSQHVAGRAVDIGNEEIAASLLPLVATDTKVSQLGIDEIIFDAAVAGESDRNKWNYDIGAKHAYDAATLDQHKNHIHFAVTA